MTVDVTFFQMKHEIGNEFEEEWIEMRKKNAMMKQHDDGFFKIKRNKKKITLNSDETDTNIQLFKIKHFNLKPFKSISI